MAWFFGKKNKEEKKGKELVDVLKKDVDSLSSYVPKEGEFDRYFDSLDITLQLLQNYRNSVNMSKLDVSVLDRQINYRLNYFVHSKMNGDVSKNKMMALLETYAEDRGNDASYNDMDELIERVKASYVLMSSDEYKEKNDINHQAKVNKIENAYQNCLDPMYEYNIISGKTSKKSIADLERELPEKTLNERRLNFVREMVKDFDKDKFLVMFREVLERDIFSDSEIGSHILAAERDYEKVKNEKYENVVLFGIYTELVVKGKGVSEDKFLRKKLAKLADNEVVYKTNEYKEYEAQYNALEKKNSKELEKAVKMTRGFYDAYLAEAKGRESGGVNRDRPKR